MLIIKNINIIPMNTEILLKNYNLIIEGEKIQSISPNISTEELSDSIVIDGTGKYLIPGLSDMHIHLNTEEDLTLALVNGVTTVRNVFGFPHHLEWKKEIETGLRIGPRIFTSGKIIDGENPFLPYASVVTTPEEAIQEVLNQKSEGYDFIKTFNGLTKQNYEQVTATAKENNMKIIGHIPFEISVEEALSFGQNSFEHLEGYWHEVIRDDLNDKSWKNVTGKKRYIEMYTALPDKITALYNESDKTDFDIIDYDKLYDLSEKTKKYGAWNVPTLVVTQRDCIPLNERKELIEEISQFVHPAYKAFWDSRDQDSDQFNTGLKIWHEHRKSIVYSLHKAGAGILVGTDSPNPYVLPGFSVHDELQFLVDSGLSPYEALKSATSNCAKFLNLEDKLGTIEVGKFADLVLLEENPLEDISNTRKISSVICSGRLYDLERIQNIFNEIVANFSKMEVEV
ncbi:MAG: amidohydrolase family protein [Candidatus Delongbacteria bacterium]|nr:amidohydrolase family protein [Candidatus Delongbacteria bacterium]MBN2835279.1 amidohydrolase family protein [Candidatus Delongbacteria bacterium]